jgi:hypothetical protein
LQPPRGDEHGHAGRTGKDQATTEQVHEKDGPAGIERQRGKRADDSG